MLGRGPNAFERNDGLIVLGEEASESDRLTLVEQLAPDDANIAIQENLNIELNGTGITDCGSQQTATFDFYMLDRVGNQSNSITSTAITVSK